MARSNETGNSRVAGGVPMNGVAVNGVAVNGWWRRNRWPLVALAPILALALTVSTYDHYREYWNSAPRTPVTAASDGWVSFANAEFRLDALATATKLTDDLGAPVHLPAGMAIWSAKISFQSTHPDPLFGCVLMLHDTAGQTYADNPAELTDLGVNFDFASCGPDTSTGKTPTTWTTTAYFVAPTSARPDGIQVTMDGHLPRYAWLTAR